MSRFYAAVTIKDPDGKLFAFVEPFTESDNIVSKFEMRGILHANVYTTKKRASEVVDFWNDCYRRNGTYKFA